MPNKLLAALGIATGIGTAILPFTGATTAILVGFNLFGYFCGGFAYVEQQRRLRRLERLLRAMLDELRRVPPTTPLGPVR